MKTTILASAKIVAAVALMLGLTGCQAFRASTTDLDVNDPVHMGARYDYSDMRRLTEEVAKLVGEIPIVLLVDHEMDDGYGTEVVEIWEALAPKPEDSLVLRWTGNPVAEEELRRGKHGRADLVFPKPVSFGEVRGAIRQFVGSAAL